MDEIPPGPRGREGEIGKGDDKGCGLRGGGVIGDGGCCCCGGRGNSGGRGEGGGRRGGALRGRCGRGLVIGGGFNDVACYVDL